MFLPIAMLLEGFITVCIFTNLSRIRYGFFKFVSLSLFLALLAYVSFYLIPDMGIMPVAINIANIVILGAFSYGKIRAATLCMFYAILSIIIGIFSGYTVGVAMLFLFGQPEGYIFREQIVPFASYSVSFFLLAFSTSRWLGMWINKLLAMFDDSLKRQLAMYMLGTVVVTLALFFMSVFLNSVEMPIAPRNLVYALLFTVYLASIFFALYTFTDNMRKNIEISHANEMLANLQEYTKSVEEMTVETRKFRHDHRNLLLGFHEHISKKDFDGLLNYYEEYLSSFVDSTAKLDSQLNCLQLIEVPELKSIFSSKLLYAQHLKINVHIEVPDVISGINGRLLIDVCRIVGILLDNAIEACQSLGVETSALKFYAARQDLQILFVFINDCPASLPSISQMYEEGFTTKESKRGNGLHIANFLCACHDNVTLNTHMQDGFFIQELYVAPESE